MELKIAKIAEMLGGVYHGDGNIPIHSVNTIEDANEGEITFLANKKYCQALGKTKASAVVVSRKQEIDITQIVVPDAYVAFGTLLRIFYPQTEVFRGVSERAFLEEGALLAEDAVIFPFVCIRQGACIGRMTTLYPGVYIGKDARIGDNCVLHANVVVAERCLIGDRVIIHAGSVIGADGFGFAQPGVNNVKIPQVGIVQIEDDCEIGANSTVDRGVIGKTLIRKNVKIDNLVQIAHNVIVGENSVIAAQAGIAGSAKIGVGNVIGGQTGIAGHITIADNVMIAGRSGVHSNLAAYSVVAGSPQRDYQKWLRIEAVISHLPQLRETLNSLQERVDKLESVTKNFDEEG